MKRLILITAFFALASGCGDNNPSQNNSAETIHDERDGSTYRAVKMPNGTVWTAQNLNIKIGNSWCYRDSNTYCNKYGRLYDWETARMACPEGWHLPNVVEWWDLAVAVGGYDIAGKKLKAKKGWYDYRQASGVGGNGTDNYGFSALPGGYRTSGGGFYNTDSTGYWWVGEKFGSDRAYIRAMNSRFDNLGEADYPLNSGLSVRCIKDQ